MLLCPFFSNTGYYGGGIYSTGVLTVQNSTLYSNTASSAGGGIANSASGTLFVLNSTLSGNTGPNGGGILNENALTLLNSTLSGNSGTGTNGGGLRDTSSALTFRNTIIANSTGGDCVKPSGVIVANVRNLVEDGGCSAALSGDPALGPLANNGGDTFMHALLPASPVIDAGDGATCLAADQRGVARPQNETCDIGAYEAPAQAILRLTKSVTPATGVPYHGVVTYTVVLSNSGATTDAAVWLTDTLPALVDFGSWVDNPGASVSSDVITWNGSLSSRQAITFTWTATHAGAYNDSVVNTAQASDAILVRSAVATFTVSCANSMTVQNSLDSGAGSLRQALTEVCAGGLVDFAPGLAGQAIVLSSALSINKNVTIDGRSLATPVTVDGNNAVRILRVTSNISATLAGLTLARGRAQPAGALLVDTGAVVTLTNATVLSNTSTSDGGGVYNYGVLNIQGSTFSGNNSSIDGGSIYNTGRLNVQGSTFTSNTANDDGGGLYNRGTLNAQGNTFTRNRSNDDGGGLYIDGGGPALVTNTTFSANTSGYWGGALTTNSSGVITLTNSTLTGNAASVAGGGVRNLGKLGLRNTIIANSTLGVDCVNVGTLTSNLNNLVKDGTCGAALSGDPALGPLANNGGGTLTHALWPNSPAIDAGNDAGDICPATDQRGVARPQNLHCDIGAVEAPARLPLLAKSVTPNSNVPYHSVVTYTLLLSNRGSESDPDVWITDTLPTQVDFGGWVQNSGASMVGDQLTWRGAVGTSSVYVFVFTATHTGAAFNEAVLNTAPVSGTQLASAASATFTVACTISDTVQNTLDDGTGSLRQALRGICAGGFIDFDPSLAGQSIVLTSSLVISKNVTIDGQELATPVMLSGNGAVRILKVTNNARVTLAGLTLARGRDTGTECSAQSCGGAFKVEAGAVVTVTNSTVLSSTAYYGGGISNFGTLLIQASTIAGNVGGWDGGGLYNKGTLTVQNSTVSGNTGNYGGGIAGVDGITILQNSTLAGNTANGGGGGGLRQYGGTLHYTNTLLADNLTGGDCYVSASNVISTNVNNLVRNGAICSAALSGDPVLGPLADNGGRTLTHALLAGSAAIDAAGDICPATDQRDVARPQGTRCDIGAVEARAEATVSKFVTPVSDVPYHGPVTYTVRLANAGPITDTAVVFSDTLPAQVIFGQWVEKPDAATLVNGNRLTWSGIITPGNVITVSWTALHIGNYGDTVVNTAAISGTTRMDIDTATFTVISPLRGAAVSPPTAAQSGDPGSVVTYTLTLTNTGNANDTFTISVGSTTFTTTVTPTSVGPMSAGSSRTVTVTVQIPTSAAGGASDAATITATSQGDGSKTANSTLTTTANTVRGVMLAPPTASQSGNLGTTVTYTLTLTNTGNAADTFTLSKGSTTFTTTVTPTSVGPVSAGASRTVTVTVQIPPGAAGGASEAATITATSQGDGSKTDASTLTTTVNTVRGVMLAPPTASQSGNLGTTVTYTLTLTNTGNAADTFTLSKGSTTFTTTVTPTSVGPVSAGASGTVTVTVQIPPGAAGGASEAATVMATSQGDGSKTDDSTLTTTVNTVIPTPTIITFSPTGGAVGTSVTITGTNFTSVISVMFSGVSASFSEISATQISVSVPVGATTGKISVTTPGGTVVSGMDFTVLEYMVYLPLVCR